VRKVRRQWRGTGALLAALLFLVQSFGAAYAQGLASRPVERDAFGNPLCITSHLSHDTGGADRHASLTDCCALACASMGGSAAMPDDAARLTAPDVRLLARLRGAVRAVHHVAADGMAGDPRAPPQWMEPNGHIGHPIHCHAA
jgi:hypothetical protein